MRGRGAFLLTLILAAAWLGSCGGEVRVSDPVGHYKLSQLRRATAFYSEMVRLVGTGAYKDDGGPVGFLLTRPVVTEVDLLEDGTFRLTWNGKHENWEGRWMLEKGVLRLRVPDEQAPDGKGFVVDCEYEAGTLRLRRWADERYRFELPLVRVR